MRRFFSLVPFFIFLIIYIGLNINYPLVDADVKSDFALFSVFIALIASFFTFKWDTPLNKRVATFIKGAAQEPILHMCFVFLFSTMLTSILDKTGGSQAAIDLALYFMPKNFLLPGIFITTSLFAVCIGTSIGAIVAFMPIFFRFAELLHIDVPVVAGIVVGGAMFGDNISLLSDTTIAATNVTGSSMIDKLKENLYVALPACIATLTVLFYFNKHYIVIEPLIFPPSVSWMNLLKISPYLFTFTFALIGFDILFELVGGILLATAIGLYLEKIDFLDTLTFFDHGFYKSKGIVGIFILVLLLSGLSQIVKHNGGITFLLERLGRDSKSYLRTKLEVLFLVIIVNCAIAINTISILLVGPIASKLAKNKLSFARTANILDIGACVSQGILPYTPQMLLAATICKVSPLEIMPYLFYPYFLLVSLLGSIFLQKK